MWGKGGAGSRERRQFDSHPPAPPWKHDRKSRKEKADKGGKGDDYHDEKKTKIDRQQCAIHRKNEKTYRPRRGIVHALPAKRGGQPYEKEEGEERSEGIYRVGGGAKKWDSRREEVIPCPGKDTPLKGITQKSRTLPFGEGVRCWRGKGTVVVARGPHLYHLPRLKCVAPGKKTLKALPQTRKGTHRRTGPYRRRTLPHHLKSGLVPFKRLKESEKKKKSP